MLWESKQGIDSPRTGRRGKVRRSDIAQGKISGANDILSKAELRETRKNSLKLFSWDRSFFGNMVISMYDSQTLHPSREHRIRRSRSLPKRDVHRRGSLVGEYHPKRLRQVNQVRIHTPYYDLPDLSGNYQRFISCALSNFRLFANVQ